MTYLLTKLRCTCDMTTINELLGNCSTVHLRQKQPLLVLPLLTQCSYASSSDDVGCVYKTLMTKGSRLDRPLDGFVLLNNLRPKRAVKVIV